jgi:hypothetical protein
MTIYNTQLNNGSYQCHQLDKVRANAMHEMRKELKQRYARKLCHFADHHKPDRSCSVQRDDGYHRHNYSKRHGGDGRHGNTRGKMPPPPHVTTRISSLARCTEITPSTPTRNAGQTRTIKSSNLAQTTATNTRTPIMRATTSMCLLRKQRQ